MNRSKHIYTAYSLDELLQLVRDSDNLAFDELYRRTWKQLYTHAFQKLRDEDFAKDVVQEVFVDFWNKRQHPSLISCFRGRTSRTVGHELLCLLNYIPRLLLF